MTLTEFFENHVLPILAERQDSADSYEDTFVGVINTVLADCLDVENSIRQKKGTDPVSVNIYAADDEIPYDLEFLLNCVCWGVASRLIPDEAGDESNMFIFLENNYQNGKEKYSVAHYENVENVWGVGGES
ncbi:MAG: hypothetical protein ACOX7J_00240 [Bacillota bacterium]|jgi:hypothetical protein